MMFCNGGKIEKSNQIKMKVNFFVFVLFCSRNIVIFSEVCLKCGKLAIKEMEILFFFSFKYFLPDDVDDGILFKIFQYKTHFEWRKKFTKHVHQKKNIQMIIKSKKTCKKFLFKQTSFQYRNQF